MNSIPNWIVKHKVGSALGLLVAAVAIVALFAHLISVPISHDDYDLCLSQAAVDHAAYNDCSKSETLWHRGMGDPVAYYTLWLMIFTLALAVGGLLQSFLVSDQIKLSREEFVATQRPKLRVRKVSIDEPVENAAIRVHFEVINVGATRARVVRTEITVRVDQMLGHWQLAGRGTEVTGTRQIYFADQVQAGESVLAAGDVINFDPAWGFTIPSWYGGRLHVIGVIQYMDENGVSRRTGFYRTATDDRNRFKKAKIGEDALADYEYED